MLDKLIDFLLNIIDQLIPIKIIYEYQSGILFRFGKFKRILNSGLHWKIPWFDDIDVHGIATTTLLLPAQSLTTKDGKSVVIKAQIKYKISDIQTFGVEIYDGHDALSDVTCGVIASCIQSKTWDELMEMIAELNSMITKEAKKEAKLWGIEVKKVTITDYAQMYSLRLFNEIAHATKN